MLAFFNQVNVKVFLLLSLNIPTSSILLIFSQQRSTFNFAAPRQYKPKKIAPSPAYDAFFFSAHKEATARSFLPFNCTINVPPAILPTETGALTIRPSRPRTRDAWEEGFFCALAVSRKKSTRTLSYYSFSGKTLNGTPQSSMPGQQGAE